MEQRPEQPPEGKLISAAADRMDLSIREAAKRTGISYGRWRQIVTGYQNVSPGSFAEVRAPAKTLARMARTVRITPEQMETEGQRPDVAAIMRSVPIPAAVNSAIAAGINPDNPDDPWIRTVTEDIQAAWEIHGEDATGAQVFNGAPESSTEALIWDDKRLSEESKLLGIATLRAWRHRDEAGKKDSGRSGHAGLAPLVTLAQR